MKDTIHSSPVLERMVPSGSQYTTASPDLIKAAFTKGLAS